MNSICRINSLFNAALNFLAPVVDLAARAWVAWVFFKSGLVKIQSWDSTVMLFQYEYNVPLLPPQLAAIAGTATELLMPALLVLGLFGRWPATILFFFNIVAAISYPDISAAGISQHVVWGLILALLAVHGSGKLTLDSLVFRHFCGRGNSAKTTTA
ncbi:MAG TPA: DoxX family protein [Gammaproteobacteria bacterium]|nr:DoxX family protein [Gammaproteobacteria bacterium]